VHAPWGMALQTRLGEEWGADVDLMWSDDGIVIRLPEALDRVPVDELLFDPDEIEDIIVSRLPDTAMFAARFRECSARALLLPRRRPDQRTPLWQQRQRAADLLSVASKYPSFPMLLEATRECVNDVFDLPALRQVMSDLRSRKIRTVAVDTDSASPFAQSLLFSWIAVYMYEGDARSAERQRSLSIGNCSEISWALRSCGSCSMQRCSPTSSSSSSALSTVVGLATPMSSTMPSAASGRSIAWGLMPAPSMARRSTTGCSSSARSAGLSMCGSPTRSASPRLTMPFARCRGRRPSRRAASGLHRPGRRSAGRPVPSLCTYPRALRGP